MTDTRARAVVRSIARPLVLITNSIAEIRSSGSLRVYGALLALTHVVTFGFWTTGKNLPAMFSQPPSSAVCWPFFEDCWRLRPLPPALVHAVVIGYGALAVIGTLLFFGHRWSARCTTWAYAALLAMNVVKLAIFILDYRLMGNYHYMPFVISFAFLFLPEKAMVCRYLIVGFYVSAGSLKLNAEWLSGAALLRPPLLTGWLGDASLAYVVLLELVLVLGLLSNRPLVLFATLGQLLVFHIYSWHIVGYFYPCIMFCLLGCFPLWFFAGVDRAMSLADRLLHLRLMRTTWLALALYAAAQIAPRLFPGDVALTGEGRFFALNMLDAKSQCSLLIINKQGNVHTERATLLHGLGVRIRCEPLVYFNVAHGMCRKLGASGDIDLGLVSRRATDTWYQPVVSVTDMCARDLEFDVWHHNDWMDP